jgi:nucleoside-diphosphate-sugar epimerase
MNVLVTGGAGYLGSRIVPRLLLRGHKVRVVDLGPLSIGQLPHQAQLEAIRIDLTQIVRDDRLLKEITHGCDAIIHLAAVSSDGAADRDAETTHLLNVEATRVLGQEARSAKARFVFSSTCAVYGSVDGVADEEQPVNPQSRYAESKVEAEAGLRNLADDAWTPITVRNGTLFGYSPRMRFDLVVNAFCLHSALRNEITVFGGGRQWRPFLHVDDCARAFVHFVERAAPAYDCYNIGHLNAQVIDLVEVFRKINPLLSVSIMEDRQEDDRDYRVTTVRAQNEGFRTRIDLEMGAEELMTAMVTGLVPDPETARRRVPTSRPNNVAPERRP